MTYLPRQDMANARIREAEIYCSSSTSDWGQPVATAEWRDFAGVQRVIFPRPVKARFLKIVAKREQHGQPFVAVAELDILTEQSSQTLLNLLYQRMRIGIGFVVGFGSTVEKVDFVNRSLLANGPAQDRRRLIEDALSRPRWDS